MLQCVKSQGDLTLEGRNSGSLVVWEPQGQGMQESHAKGPKQDVRKNCPGVLSSLADSTSWGSCGGTGVIYRDLWPVLRPPLHHPTPWYLPSNQLGKGRFLGVIPMEWHVSKLLLWAPWFNPDLRRVSSTLVVTLLLLEESPSPLRPGRALPKSLPCTLWTLLCVWVDSIMVALGWVWG